MLKDQSCVAFENLWSKDMIMGFWSVILCRQEQTSLDLLGSSCLHFLGTWTERYFQNIDTSLSVSTAIRPSGLLRFRINPEIGLLYTWYTPLKESAHTYTWQPIQMWIYVYPCGIWNLSFRAVDDATKKSSSWVLKTSLNSVLTFSVLGIHIWCIGLAFRTTSHHWFLSSGNIWEIQSEPRDYILRLKPEHLTVAASTSGMHCSTSNEN